MNKLTIIAWGIVLIISSGTYAQSFDWTQDTYFLTVQESNGNINQNIIKDAPHEPTKEMGYLFLLP